MTIKRRLFWSNILMIIVPVIATAIIGILSMTLLWAIIIHSRTINIDDEDHEDLDYAYIEICDMIENRIADNSDLSFIEPFLQSTGMTLQVLSEGKTTFEYGIRSDPDPALISAAEFLGDGSTVSLNGRKLYARKKVINDSEYTIYLFNNLQEPTRESDMKVILVLYGIVIIFTVFLSVLLTNRFLTRFVFKKIEEPLDILTNGVHEIRDGNLEYRIQYNRKDEFASVCSDFNEMAVRLKESVDMMQQQEKSRRELITGISHDLRSPLTSIQAYVEGLLDGIAKSPEAQKRYLETIKIKAQDLAHIISQLFLLSKMEMGEYPESPCMISLDEKISETVSALKDEYEQKGLTINMKLVPAKIYADPIQVQRIVTNILENSLKYKNKEQGNVSVQLEKTDKGYSLSFLDDGPGVPEEALPHLFEVFYRSDPSRQNPNKGSGLGLAIVANAVRRMGGSAKAFANTPCGLGIRIDFPFGGEQQ